MTVAELANGVITCLSSDTKPTTYPTNTLCIQTDATTHAPTFFIWNGSAWLQQQIANADVASSAAIAFSKIGTNLILSESGLTAARTMTWPDATAKVVCEATTQTLSNKTIDAVSNTLLSIYQNPLVKRTGAVIPGQGASTNSIRPEGILFSVTAVGAGSLADGFDTTEGKTSVFTSTAAANVNAGITGSGSGSGVGRRLFGMRMITRGKINQHTASRYYFGFTSATTLPISDNPLATTDNGAIMGFRSTDVGNYQAFTCDGAGTVTATDLGVAIDANFHTFEINWTASGNVNFIVDGGTPTTVSATLPSTASNLFVNNVGQTTATATAVIYTSKGMWIAADK